MFRKNWKPGDSAVAENPLPDEGLLTLWKHYVDTTNDRHAIHGDDDLWGINTQVIGAGLGMLETLVSSKEPKIRLFRQNLIALFLFKNLCMSVSDAVDAYSENHDISGESDLAGFGLVVDNNLVFDLRLLVTVKESDPHFDYFFVQKLSQLDIMKIDPFLEYQFRESFESNYTDFRLFLSRILMKYGPEKSGEIKGVPAITPDLSTILEEKIAHSLPLIKIHSTAMSENEPTGKAMKQPKPEIMQPDFTNRQWAAFTVIALEAFGLDSLLIDDNISNGARFLHIIMGKPIREVGNSEQYKRIKEVLSLKYEKRFKNDLNAIRPHFENVGWKNAIERIDLKIRELEEKENKNKKKRKVGGTPTTPPNGKVD